LFGEFVINLEVEPEFSCPWFCIKRRRCSLTT
jgi:hypothetical protein